MNALLWAAFCFFFAGLCITYVCYAIVTTHRMAYAQGMKETKPLRLKNGQLMGRKL